MSKLEKELVLEQLQNLRRQEGLPASLAELRQIVISTYPQFSQKALKAAAKVNQKSSNQSGKLSPLTKMLVPMILSGVGIIGLIGLVNLPYPMIRKPVAKIAPILLLPSYMSMDRNYREAIAVQELLEDEAVLLRGTGLLKGHRRYTLVRK